MTSRDCTLAQMSRPTISESVNEVPKAKLAATKKRTAFPNISPPRMSPSILSLVPCVVVFEKSVENAGVQEMK